MISNMRMTSSRLMEPASVYSVDNSTGHFSVRMEQDGRLVSNVTPLTIAARSSGGMFSPPSPGDKCLVFFDYAQQPYALFTWYSQKNDDGSLDLSKNFPSVIDKGDFWLGSGENNYICLRKSGDCVLYAAPMCSITLTQSNRSITFNCEAYEFFATGMTTHHTVDTTLGVQHSELYYDVTTASLPIPFYEYTVKDALSMTKLKASVDKLGIIQLKLGQAGVVITNAGITINIGEPSATTSIIVDSLGNVTLSTKTSLTLDAPVMLLGQMAKSMSVKGESLIQYLLTHTHPTAAIGPPSMPTPYPADPTLLSLLSTKVFLE